MSRKFIQIDFTSDQPLTDDNGFVLRDEGGTIIYGPVVKTAFRGFEVQADFDNAALEAQGWVDGAPGSTATTTIVEADEDSPGSTIDAGTIATVDVGDGGQSREYPV